MQQLGSDAGATRVRRDPEAADVVVSRVGFRIPAGRSDVDQAGIHAAARAAFDTTPDKLSAQQAALLASVLPNPKARNAARPTAAMRRRAAQIVQGAETIRQDGRADCFQIRGG